MIKYGLLGHNIGYSLSPNLHNTHFNIIGIPAHYELIDILNIEDNLAYLKEFSGFNVTIPFKEKIIDYCTTLNDEEEFIRAINCVKVVDNCFLGYNTDVYGFYKLLEVNELLKKDKLSVLIIGFGGAGKAVYHCFKKYTDYDIYVTNRTIDKVKQISSKTLSIKDAGMMIQSFDIVVNCTNLCGDLSPIDFTKTKKHAVFIDINYQSKSKFLACAESLDAKTINGLTMLLYQAAKSFEIWFDKKPDINAISRGLRKD